MFSDSTPILTHIDTSTYIPASRHLVQSDVSFFGEMVIFWLAELQCMGQRPARLAYDRFVVDFTKLLTSAPKCIRLLLQDHMVSDIHSEELLSDINHIRDQHCNEDIPAHHAIQTLA